MIKHKPLNIFLFSISILICTSFAIPKQTIVPANKDWTNTEYSIQIGDKIEIVTAGEITIDGIIKCNPEGISNNPDLQKQCIIKTSNPGCIIGKIGEKGKPFFVGRNSIITSVSAGNLFLGVNDKNCKNNTGEFLSIITITAIIKDSQAGK